MKRIGHMLNIEMRLQTEKSTEWNGSAGGFVAVLLARVVVPLWLLVGAILKLVDASPSHLPVAMVKWLGALNIDLMFVLEFSIAIELTVVGVMWLLPRLARLAGVLMLGSFLPVLLGDVLMGAGFGLTGIFAATPAAGAADLVADLPADGYYLPQYDAWIGKPWQEVPLSAWVIGAPDDLAVGPRYLLLYRKDCEHCHELMEVFFTGPLEIPTTAVAVPEREGFPDHELPFACSECSNAELPAGVDWFVQTPALVRLFDGIVECASELTADNPICLDW
jgi:hypothetical protein